MTYTTNSNASTKQRDTTLEKVEPSDSSISSADTIQDFQNDTSLQKELSTSLGGRIFTTDNGGFPWRNIQILNNEEPIFFAEVSQFTRKTPDMVWHSGNKSGPLVGYTYLHWGPRSIECGLGSEGTTMKWFELKRSGFAHTKRFEVEWEGKVFMIRRSNCGARSGQYHVIDAQTKEIVAKHVSEFRFGSMRRDKTVTFKPGVDEELQLLLIMGVTAWREKSRRRRHAANRQPY